MHETCGCSFSDIERVHGFNIPLHLLSVGGQEKLDRHSSSSRAPTHSHHVSKNNKNDLLMCSMCIEMIKGEVIAAMNDVMKVLKEENADQREQHFDADCSLIASFPASAASLDAWQDSCHMSRKCSSDNIDVPL